jgi:RNA polymerase sigma-70 factor, ECF subfamily
MALAMEAPDQSSRDRQRALSAAFIRVAEANRGKIFGFILKYVDDPDLAADLTQEAFLRAAIKLDQVQNPETMGTWVGSIAKNEIRQRYRAHRGEVAHSLLEDVPESKLHSSWGNPEKEVIEKETQREEEEERRVLHAALAQLPEEKQEVMRLRYLEGLTTKKIAEQKGMPEGTVKTWVNRGLAQLRTEFVRQTSDNDEAGGAYPDGESQVASPPEGKKNLRRAVLEGVDAEKAEMALSRLPDHYRYVLVLRERERLSYAEIGERVPNTSVMNILHRARSRFGKELALVEAGQVA